MVALARARLIVNRRNLSNRGLTRALSSGVPRYPSARGVLVFHAIGSV
jgi:hypothetical protein